MLVRIMSSRLWVIGGMIALLTLGFVLDLREHNSPSVSLQETNSSAALKVGSVESASLSTTVPTNDIPINSSVSPLQSATPTPEQSSYQTLQSNVSINSAAVASNPIVQSLLDSGNP